MISNQDLQKLSQLNGIDKFTILREYVQIGFLNSLYQRTGPGSLIFKGGTAMRFFLNSPRFSEDLDFISDLPPRKIKEISNSALEIVKRDIENIEMRDIKSPAGISRKIYVITDISSFPLTIKLDFSKRERAANSKIGIIKTNLPIVSTTPITYLDPKEISAEKIRALMTRTKGRDLFDLWFLSHNGYKPGQDLIQKKLNFYNKRFDKNKLIEKINNWDEKGLMNDINKFLPIQDRTIVPELKKLTLEEIKNL